MSIEDIQEVVRQFAQAAKNATTAGFDGVEIHGAHGYLIDQFNSDLTNKRTDRYGGDFAQRLTFMKEVLAAVIDADWCGSHVNPFFSYERRVLLTTSWRIQKKLFVHLSRLSKRLE